MSRVGTRVSHLELNKSNAPNKMKRIMDRLSNEVPFCITSSSNLAKTCEKPGCTGTQHRGRFCKNHRICAVTECKRVATIKGFCDKHRSPCEMDWLDATEIHYRNNVIMPETADMVEPESSDSSSLIYTNSSEEEFLDLCECEIGEGSEREILLLPPEDEKIIKYLVDTRKSVAAH